MLKIGWASRDVSTNDPVGIGGQKYERISQGSYDPTTITVLAMEDGSDQVFFISGDFTSITQELLTEVRAAVAEKTSAVDVKKIIFSATHTHTAPRYASHSIYDKAPHDRVRIDPPEKYRKFLVDRVADAVMESYENRAEGSFSYGYGTATVACHRRSVYFNDQSANNALTTYAVNGHGVMYGKTNKADFSGFEGAIDTNVYLLYTFDQSGKLTGAIVNVPCPSQCTGHQSFTSADYWHETRELIRQKHGDIYILPQCAAAGDLSPRPLYGYEALERKNRLKFIGDEKVRDFKEPFVYYTRRIIAENIAHAFDECLEWASRERIEDASIKHRTEIFALDAWRVTEEEYDLALRNYADFSKIPFKETDDPYADFEENTELSGQLARCEKVIRRYEENADFVDTEVHVLKIGEIAFVSCPFELFLDYQHRIQGRSPFVQTFMVQLAGSETSAMGYLATERAAKNKGYSAIMYSCRVSPYGGQTLVEKSLEILEEIK